MTNTEVNIGEKYWTFNSPDICSPPQLTECRIDAYDPLNDVFIITLAVMMPVCGTHEFKSFRKADDLYASIDDAVQYVSYRLRMDKISFPE